MYNEIPKNFLIAILIPALLSCGAPAHKQIPPPNYNLTALQATDVDWGRQKMQLVGIDGAKYNGTLLGWTNTGFIMESENGVEILPYDSLRDYIQMDSGKNHETEGFLLGTGAVIGLISLLSYLGKKANKSSDSDTSFSATKDLSPIYIFPIIGLVAVICSPSYFGGLIGSKIKKYDKYYFNPEDFKSHPYFYKPGDVINKSEKDLP